MGVKKTGKMNGFYYCKKTHKKLTSLGFDIVVLKHCYRINGCVDLWFNRKTLFDKTASKYMNFDNKEELFNTAVKLAGEYGKHEPFKKTAKGNMTYQEFKYRMAGKM